MKPAPFDYIAPGTIEQACKALSDAGGGATVIAGGQTLMPLLNLRMSQPFIVVDINSIAALQGIEKTAQGIRIGAATRQCDALQNALLAEELPLLVTALGFVGHHQTRNRGTVVGSVVLGEPAAEMPACAVALGATIEVASVRGRRSIPASEFYLGPYMNALEFDELVTGVVYPAWPKPPKVIFKELMQRPGDFALTGIAGSLACEDGTITKAGLAWMAMGPTPVRALDAERLLTGCRTEQVDIDQVVEAALAATHPFDDQRAAGEYRRTVGKRLLKRALLECFRQEVAL